MHMDENEEYTGLELAVVGVSGRFPGANNIDEYWNNLKNSVESISFFTEEELEEMGIDPELVKAPNYVKAKGMVEDIEYFDHSFFDYPPKEAELMDPQLRLLHECTWEAFEDAGYDPEKVDGLIGVYIGGASNPYWLYRFFNPRYSASDQGMAEILNNNSAFSTRLSYKFNLKGPSYTLQTTCSSSLVSIHLACQALLGGECDMALAGGVRITLPKKNGYLYHEGMVHSPDGHCRAFDEKAEGIVMGDGVGLVVLKRLEDALKDKDHIYAIVKGSAINNDGARKVGYAAPSIEGQAEVIKAALQMAEVEPESITYVETHGTGTKLGDPIEIEGLKSAFNTDEKNYCKIGSVKTNVGHLDTASGVAAFIKTVLSLKHRTLVPSLHFQAPNPQIDFENSPFQVSTELMKWENPDFPLRAGISSFGIGGTNAHIIVEEAPQQEATSIQGEESNEEWRILPLSAKTESALNTMTNNLIEHLKGKPSLDMKDLAYTLQQGRKDFQHRRMMVAKNQGEVIENFLGATYNQGKLDGEQECVFLFPGQGAQYVNMGRELYYNLEEFRKELDTCFNILQKITDKNFKEILYLNDIEEEINKIEINQPLVFSFEYALAKLLMSWGIKPHAMMGYSLGEYVAATLAGVFDLEGALELVVFRSQLLREVPPAMMLNVPLSEEELKPLLTEGLSVAIDNGDSCIVVGNTTEIGGLEGKLKERRCISMRLENLHPGHSKEVRPVMGRLEEKLKTLLLNKPQIPFVSALTGNWITEEEATDPAYWMRHMEETVRFVKGIKELVKKENYTFLEVGPGRDLTVLVRRYLTKENHRRAINITRPHQQNKSDLQHLYQAIGQLWLLGMEVKWEDIFKEEGSKVPLPTYPFEGRYFDIDIQTTIGAGSHINTPKDHQSSRMPQRRQQTAIIDRREGSNYAPPRNELEKKIIKALEGLFGLENLGINDDFFDLGGDSLKAIFFTTKLKQELQIEIPLKQIFNTPTVEGLASYLEDYEKSSFPPLEVISGMDYYEVSPPQKRLYIINQLDPDSIAYNIPVVLRLRGKVDLKKLEHIFQLLVLRHEVLRTNIKIIGEEVHQIINPTGDFRIEYMEASNGNEGELIEGLIRPFDLEREWLIRVGLVKISEEEHLLLMDVHHIVVDGISMGILIRELGQLYDGKELQPIPYQYKDFAHWQNKLIREGYLDQQKDYWLDRFKEEVPALNMPLDFPRPPIKSQEGEHIHFTIGSQLYEKLQALSKEQKVTMNMLVLAAYYSLLHLYTGQEDIVVGIPIAGRQQTELHDMLGMFVNTLAVRNKPMTNKSFREFLLEVKENVIQDYQNQDYQLEDLVEALDLNIDNSRNPLFDAMFISENLEITDIQLDGLTLEPYERGNQTSKFDLSLYMEELEEDIKFNLEYCTKLFKRESMEGLINHFKIILEEISKGIEVKLGEINLLSKEEEEKILYDFNNQCTLPVMEETIHQLFQQQVEKTPDKIALVYENQSLTYGELNKKANQLARLLVEKGVKNDKVVGIMVERSLEMMMGIMAVLKAGGAYLPIDPKYPLDRIQYVLEDSGCNILLTQSSEISRIQDEGIFNEEVEVVVLDDPTIYQGDHHNLDINYQSQDLAYIIYTSGSTGKPKGVMVQHNSAVNILSALEKDYPLLATDAYLLKTAYTFDVSVTELFGWFMGEGRLVILREGDEKDPKALVNAIHQHQVTHMNFVPSMLKVFLQWIDGDEIRKLRSLKYIFAAGEALSKELVEEVYGKIQDVRLENIYGPTEATIYVTRHSVERQRDYTNIPIGKPMANIKGYIVNANQKLLPIGIPGELWIAGWGVTRGYINNPQLTDEKFISNPFMEGEKVYRTGDLARWLPDGNIEFLGRIDHQVKVRGYRIELGEIESQLVNHPKINEAVVVPKEEDTGTKYLCGYIVVKDELSPLEVREYLSNQLPEYMIPSHIVVLDKMPLNSSGKIDRRALPNPDGEILGVVEYEAPRNEIEATLVEIWQEILGVEGIGINHNFFALGGHSLKATRMVVKIHKEFNVEVSLREVFGRPTIKGIGALVSSAAGGGNSYAHIPRVEKRECYPLSSAQKRIYTLQQLNPEGISYNMPVALMMEGKIDIQRVEAVFQKLINRHEALRTSFMMGEREPQQKIDDGVEFHLEFIDSPQGEDLDRIVMDFIKPFNLEEIPFRASMIKIDREKHLLLVDIHHIISDGVSQGILVKEFGELYGGMELEPLRLQYKGYSQWQTELFATEKLEQQKAYWLQQFEGEIPVLDLAGDYPRPAIQSFEGDLLSYSLSEEVTTGLREICSQTGATLYMVLLSAFNILLSKYSRQEDIIVGSPIAGRSHEDLKGIMGVFINTLALRNQPATNKTYQEFLEEVKRNSLDAYENQDYQFEELVEGLELKRDLSRNPLFDVMFIVQNMDMGSMELEGLQIKPYNFKNTVSKFDMTLIAIEVEERINIGIEYATSIFKEETIQRLYSHLENILRQIIKNPEVKLGEIDLVTAKEKKQLLEIFNNTEMEYPKDETLHQLFEAQVEKTPDKTALVYENQSLTYRELNEKANQLARLLVEKGVKNDGIIGIMVERSLEMMTGIMAVLKAGGGYLPIDPKYPLDRIQYMLEDSGCNILLTQSSEESRIKDEVVFNEEIILLDDPTIYQGEHHNLDIDYHSEDLAYIIYTSGSTGKPKGVMVQHNSVVNILSALQKDYPLLEMDTYLLKTAYTFDVSVTELFGWFVGNGRLVILREGDEKDPKAIINAIHQHQVTHVNFVPSMLKVFLHWTDGDEIRKLQSLKYIFSAGEALSKELVEEVYKKIQDVRLENIYGPTESTIYVTSHSVEGQRDYSNIPIGKPMANIKGFIVNANQQLLPIGVPGELWIGGTGVTRGYINNPQLTNEKFIPNPFINGENKGEKIYRTGDLARWLPNGEIEFLGRIDHQVKVRGYRIELGEIESQLVNHPEIKEAVVVAKEEDTGAKYLSGYIVVKDDISPTEVREYLSKQLPDYMIPSHIVVLDKMPLNSSGKIDRRALPDPDGEILGVVEYEAPRNEIEATLIEIWEEILGIEGIGINHNFFELGGHSLKATGMLVRIHKELNVEVSLRDVFQRPTIKGIGDLIRSAAGGWKSYTDIQRVEKRAYYPLSSAQKRIYTLQRLNPEGISYNMPVALVMEGKIDLQRVEATFQKIINRHEALRTTFMMGEREPQQKIHDEVAFRLEYIDSLQREDLDKIVLDFIKPFNLEEILLRASMVKIDDEKHLLLVDLHHIISDGVSQGILVKDFGELYGGRELEPLQIQYKDFSQWQTDLFNTKKLEEQKGYWLQQFEGEIPVLDLVGDYPRPAIKSFEGDILSYSLSQEVTTGLRKICSQTGATLYMVMLSAFNILLSKYSRQEDIIVGSPIAGRFHENLKGVMGVFINTLALRNYPVGNKTYGEFLSEVKKTALDAYENQDYQFEELVENLGLKRDLSRNPLFDIMFIMQNMDMGPMELEGLQIKPYDFKSTVSKFDMTLTAVEVEENIDIAIEYATSIFKEETIQRLYTHLENILRQIIKNPEVKLDEIELVTEEEKKQLLEIFNNTEVEYPTDQTLHQLFEAQVENTPDQTALVYEDQSLTHRELNEKANQLARLLVEKGVKRDSIVGIMVEPSLEMMTGIMAVLKAGGAYLPIDPKYPLDRIQYILEDSGCNILLTQSSGASRIKDEVIFNGEVVVLDDPNIYQGEHNNLDINYHPQDLAYIIYTSGSTGKPKGVMVQHQNVINVLSALEEEYPMVEGDSFLLKTAFTFDVSVTEIFGWFFGKGKLVILKQGVEKDIKAITNTIYNHKVTHINFVPSMLNVFVNYMTEEDTSKLKSLKYIFTAGEAISRELVEEVYRRLGHIKLENIYGPTETTIYVTKHPIEKSRTYTSIPIGRPMANTKAYIVDQNHHLQPIGVAGELCISGAGLTKGYLNKPELTNERFILNPFMEGEKIYRTGDLARWLPDGDIEFLGRIDHQVKVRGYRIELGEIESQLLNHPNIKEAVVVPKEEDTGTKYLCGYIVVKDEISFAEVREYLSKQLPEYMIPSHIAVLDQMPLNASGKIDRRALPDPDGKISGVVEYEAPTNGIEATLVGIWQEILGVEGIGINHNFFELGGHSLKATYMVAEIQRLLNIEVPMREIFKNATVKGISHYINSTARKVVYQPIVPMEEKPYYPVSSAQRRIYLQWQLAADSTSYNIPSAILLEGELDPQRVEKSIHQLISRHEAFRTSFMEIDQEVMQKIHKEIDFSVDFHEVAEGELQEITNKFIRPFDLSKAPLLRVNLIKVADQKYLLLFDMHHIISDGVSMGTLQKDFMGLYEGKELPALKVQYKDFASWHNQLMTSDTMETMKNYWMDKLKDFTATNLPTKGWGDSGATEGKTRQILLDASLTERINKYCIKHQMTKSVFLLGIFKFLIMKAINQKDITVGIPVAGRSQAELEEIIGTFVNVMLVRSFVPDDGSFINYMYHFRDNYMEAQEYQEYPYDHLFENAVETLNLRSNSLFSIMFNYLPRQQEKFEIGGLTIKPYQLETIEAKYDLTLYGREGNGEITLDAVYNSQVDEYALENILSNFMIVIEAVLSNEEILMDELMGGQDFIEDLQDEFAMDFEDNDDFF